MDEKGENGLRIDDTVLDIIRGQKPRRTLLRRGMPIASELEGLDPETIQEIADDNFYAVSQSTGKIIRLRAGERVRGHGLFNNKELPRNLRANLIA